MSFKKNIAMGMATGLIGMALISGGTVAYFSSSVETQNQIMAGTLDLGVTEVNEEGVLFEFKDKQPGDTFDYTFELSNDGSLDIGEITLESDHEVDGKSDFGSQIEVLSLKVGGVEKIDSNRVVTLDKLDKSKEEDSLVLLDSFPAESDNVKVEVEFKFIQTDEDQNDYQENSLGLTWTFKAIQEFDKE